MLVGAVVCGGAVGGCAHTVQVDSNVPAAEVRVDGEPLGRVDQGAVFSEHWGFGRVYDVEVKAPGHRIARRQVRPSVVDAQTGVPAMACAVGGCTLSTFVVPLVALYTWLAVPDADTRGKALGYGGSLGVLGCTAISTSVVAFGSERLPDEIYVELVPESGAAGLGLPPPPEDSEPTDAPTATPPLPPPLPSPLPSDGTPPVTPTTTKPATTKPAEPTTTVKPKETPKPPETPTTP